MRDDSCGVDLTHPRGPYSYDGTFCNNNNHCKLGTSDQGILNLEDILTLEQHQSTIINLHSAQ